MEGVVHVRPGVHKDRRGTRWLSTFAALAIGALAVSTASAQTARPPSADDPALQALIAEALANNPDLVLAQHAIDAGHMRGNQVPARPDPMIALTYTNDGWAPSLGAMPMTTMGLMVSQELPSAAKQKARIALAVTEAKELEPVLARTRLGIIASVKRAYYGLQLARELLALTDEQRELWRQIEVVTRTRYASGQGAQQDVLRVQVEVTRIEQRVIEQTAEIELRVAELNRLLARPIAAGLESAGRLTLRTLAQPLPDMLEAARSVSPEIAQARLAIDTGTAALAVARLDLKPTFSVQGGFMDRGGLSPMWLAGVGVAWPFNKKTRQSAIAETQVRIERDRRAVDSVDLQLRLRTQERYTRARMAEKVIDLYDQGIVPQGRMTVESAIASYQSGQTPFVSVLEAMTALFADRWTRETLVASHATLVASLEEASLDATPEMSGAGAMPAPTRSSGSGGMSGGMSGGKK
jgi:outer membrane protein TolC